MSDWRVTRRTFLSTSAVTGLSFVGSGARQSTQRAQTGDGCCSTCSTPQATQTRPLQSDGVDTADEGGNHWLAFAWAKHDAGFGRYESTLRVPCVPRDHDGRVVFFYFPAFQSYSGKGGQNGYILQPVLAWNWGGSGQWEIGTWSGSSAHGFTHSNLIPVSPGDELRAVIQRPDSLPGEWYLEMRNETTGEVAVSHSHRLDHRFRYAYLTMEANRAYDPGNCSYLPGGTLFDEIALTDWHGDRLYADWHRRRDESFDCPVSVDVHGTDRVAIGTDGAEAKGQNERSEQSGLVGQGDVSSWLPMW